MDAQNGIAGRSGHLSNEDAADLVRSALTERLRALFLAHLSEECNTPALAFSTMSGMLKRAGRKMAAGSGEPECDGSALCVLNGRKGGERCGVCGCGLGAVMAVSVLRGAEVFAGRVRRPTPDRGGTA